MRILVVDDSKTIRQIVAECLKSMGHDVVYAENGQQCLDFVVGHNVDLVLIDVEMPGMDGVEATKAIRTLTAGDWFPIIFLTSHTDDDSFTNGILAGGDAYLLKPLNPLRLQLTIIAMERIYVMRQTLQKTQHELQEVNKELERLSLVDQLTGLGNRRSFDRYLLNQFAQARRNKSALSLIVCDVDYFKNYNDTYGHQQGDDCLVLVAGVIEAQLKRVTDLACRYGGEEFMVIMPNTGLADARNLAEQIRLGIVGSKISHSGSKIAEYVTLSFGVSTYTGQFENAQQLTKTADQALYNAKEKGRNCVEFSLDVV